MKAKLVFTGLSTIIYLLTIVSCQEKGGSHFVSLDDSVQQAIRMYVNENGIDVSSRVITTDWVANPYRTDVYISTTSNAIDDSAYYAPTYYSLVSDSIIVLIYTGIERSVARNTQEISKEINDLLIKKQVQMVDSGYIGHVFTWLYTSCREKRELVRDPSMSDLFYIPCRDVVLQDSLKKDFAREGLKKNSLN